MGRITAIANMKGGTGKTTTVMNLGAALGRMKKRVLLVDTDPQSNLSVGLGVDVVNLTHSMYDVFTERIAVRDILADADGLHVAPAHLNMVAVEMELSNKIGREKTLRRALEPVRDTYDFVVVDCPPSLGLLTINGLAAADNVIIPIQSQFYALYGVTQLMQTIDIVRTELNRGLEVLGVVMTQVTHTRLAVEVAEEAKKFFGDKVFESVIHQNIRLAEAPASGMHIFQYDPASRGAEDYDNLAKEVIARCGSA
jgi:chromosome partitioning protein